MKPGGVARGMDSLAAATSRGVGPPCRISDNELKDLNNYFSRENGRMELPMQDLMWFALHSTRRVSEICRLEWQDNDPNKQSGLVRDASRPHETAAIHKRFRMTREAWDIVNRQPRTGQYIFHHYRK
jgi:integrase